MKLNQTIPASGVFHNISEDCLNLSPKSASSPKFSPLNKINNGSRSPFIFQKTLENINTITSTPQNKTIKLNMFKIQKTIIEKRARSNSPKEDDSPKTLPKIDENKMIYKYRNLRIENQETQIKINALWAQLIELGTEKTSVKERIDLCLEIISMFFKYLFFFNFSIFTNFSYFPFFLIT